MPSGSSVRPKKWARTRVLYDDGDYSVICGRYEGRDRSAIGVRWNGGDGQPLGFPNVAGHPVWHVVPDFLAIPILQGLLLRLANAFAPRDRLFAVRIRRELTTQYRHEAGVPR